MAVVGGTRVDRRLQRPPNRRIGRLPGAIDLLVAHPQGLELRTVEAGGELDEGGVALGADPGDQVAHHRQRLIARQVGTGKVGGGVGCPATVENVQHERAGYNRPMSIVAELSALSTALDELTARVVNLADARGSDDEDPIRSDLQEVERHLTQAGRRVAKSLRSLDV